jgi:hypothetical protein
MPAKSGIQADCPGFRVALAIASLPGMTIELQRSLLGNSAKSDSDPPVIRLFQRGNLRDRSYLSLKRGDGEIFVVAWKHVSYFQQPVTFGGSKDG